MSVTTVRLQSDIEEKLDAMANAQQRSKSWLINQALRDYIQHQEQEQERWQQTLEAMESVAQGEVVSSQAVHAWMRSWGKPDEKPMPQVGE